MKNLLIYGANVNFKYEIFTPLLSLLRGHTFDDYSNDYNSEEIREGLKILEYNNVKKVSVASLIFSLL